MAGDFMVVNEYLVEDLKRLGLWNEDMLEKIKYHDGSIQEIMEVPQALRDKYKEVFEIEPQWLIKAAAYRGRWIDQSQSLNIFYGGSSGKVLSEIYQYAWSLGLKTTYYLRTLGASRIEKSTLNLAKFGGTSRGDTSVASSPGSIPSTVIIEETVTIASVNQSPLLRTVVAEQAMYVPQPAVTPVVAPMLPKSEPVVIAGSMGIPSFGESAATKNFVGPTGKKIEILNSEECESCSA